MVKTFAMVISAAAAFLLFSCKPENPVEPEPPVKAPVIKAVETSFEFGDGASKDEIAYSIENPVSGLALTASSNSAWVTIGTISSSTVAFEVAANESEEDRKAVITLKYKGASNVTVNITQAYYFLVNESVNMTGHWERFQGMSIRPVVRK